MRRWMNVCAAMVLVLGLLAMPSPTRAEEEEEPAQTRPNPLERAGLILGDQGPVNPAASLGIVPVGKVGRLSRGASFVGVVSRPEILKRANPKAGFARNEQVRVSYLGAGQFSVAGLNARQPKTAILRVGGAAASLGCALPGAPGGQQAITGIGVAHPGSQQAITGIGVAKTAQQAITGIGVAKTAIGNDAAGAAGKAGQGKVGLDKLGAEAAQKLGGR